jgi:hypothetical protein
MAKERKAYAPFSLTSEAGVAQTPVEGYIDVRQEIYPTVSTGTINENGKWAGVKSSDTEFIGLTKHVAIADAGETLNPDTPSRNHIDMTGFDTIFIAVKPSASGDFLIRSIMGPNTVPFANLSPVNSGTSLVGNWNGIGSERDVELLFDDTVALTANVWNIFPIQGRLSDQKNLQFMVRNSTGGVIDIEFGFMRVVTYNG